jgi:hypothetical protein
VRAFTQRFYEILRAPAGTDGEGDIAFLDSDELLLFDGEDEEGAPEDGFDPDGDGIEPPGAVSSPSIRLDSLEELAVEPPSPAPARRPDQPTLTAVPLGAGPTGHPHAMPQPGKPLRRS